MIRKPIYFAHKLRGATVEETQANRRAACALVARFVRWAENQGAPIMPVCAWIYLAEVWSEDDGRELGLVIDCALIDLVAFGSGEMWLIGEDPTTSNGMQHEINHAIGGRGLLVVDYRAHWAPGGL